MQMVTSRIRRSAPATLLALCLMLTAGCTSNPVLHSREQTAFTVVTGFGQGLRSSTPLDIINIGLPDLYNRTSRSIRIRDVSLSSAPAAVRLLNITAHPGQAVGVIRGNLLKRCKASYPAYPVTDAIMPPHTDSNWHLVLTITITKPGTYHLRRVKITYTIGGRARWQYQNIFTTIHVLAARPGTKPVFDGCP
jgi:hypothetical protein